MKNKNFKLIKAIWEKRLSQALLVQQASLGSEARLSRIINGFVEPSRDEVQRICTLLEVTPSEVGFKQSKERRAENGITAS